MRRHIKKLAYMLTTTAGLTAITFIATTVAICVGIDCRTKLLGPTIKSFDECIEAGYPIVQEDPPRCYISESKSFELPPKHIDIFQPHKNEKISGQSTIKGSARVLNNTLYYELKDDTGTTLIEGKIDTNSPEHGRWGNFTHEITIPRTTAKKGSFEFYELDGEKQKQSTETIQIQFAEKKTTAKNTFDPIASLQSTTPPPAVNLDVPFTTQAPYANWNPPFDEACEEASLLMVEYFLRDTDLLQNTANNEIILFTEWQKDRGYTVDVTSAELAQIAAEYFNRTAKVYYNDQVTIDNIKLLLANNFPVIIPAAGQLLGNPNFRGAGPPYHMLVIKGYDDQYFYTNDPGTRNGEGYRYTHDTIINSIHDWTGNKSTITEGRKAIMVIDKNQ